MENLIILILIGQLVAGIAFLRRLRRPFPQPVHPRLARLDTLYRGIYTGSPQDKLYAWYRVREHIRNFEPDPGERERLLAEVDAIIRQTTPSFHHRVTPNGRLLRPDWHLN